MNHKKRMEYLLIEDILKERLGDLFGEKDKSLSWIAEEIIYTLIERGYLNDS